MPKFNKVFSVILALVLVATFSITSLALTADTPVDTDKKGSVSITLTDMKTSKPLTGGAVTAVKVASLVRNNGISSFEFTEEMKNCGEDLSNIESTELLTNLMNFIKSNNINGKSVNVADGKVKFEDLDLGLYLVSQTENSDKNLCIKPFLVSVPMELNNELVYDVDATPKTSVVEDKKPGPDIPQTGQLWWPVPVLAVLGVLIFVYGYSRKRKENAKKK